MMGLESYWRPCCSSNYWRVARTSIKLPRPWREELRASQPQHLRSHALPHSLHPLHQLSPPPAQSKPKPRNTLQFPWALTWELLVACLWFYIKNKVKRWEKVSPLSLNLRIISSLPVVLYRQQDEEVREWGFDLLFDFYERVCWWRGWIRCWGVGIVFILSVLMSGWRQGRVAPCVECVELRLKTMIEVDFEVVTISTCWSSMLDPLRFAAETRDVLLSIFCKASTTDPW